MTTPTHKATRRVTLEAVRDGGPPRRIIVTLGPGDVLQFRYERTRTSFCCTVRAAMQLAQRLAADAMRREKAEARKGSRKPVW